MLWKKGFRFFVCSFLVGVCVAGAGMVGTYMNMNEWMTDSDKPVGPWPKVQVAEHDPHKPTVAVVLGSQVTEVMDFMESYELFARTQAFNVYAVAPDHGVKTLSGGLHILPHYTYEELDTLLGGSPAMIVVPAIPFMDETKYRPTRQWLQRHAGRETTLISICTGAENLADAGLLKGRSAATFWADIDRLEREYADTHWIRNQRYVVSGNIVTSAGITSGIDAVLYVIGRHIGEDQALLAAREMNYPTYHFVRDPAMIPWSVGWKDAVFMLNFAYQWKQRQIGALLYDGIEETALASVFDTFNASGTANTLTVSGSGRPVRSRHGLTLVAWYQTGNAPPLNQMIIAGTEAHVLAAEAASGWEDHPKQPKPLYLHSGSPARYVMEAPIEQLALLEDKATAAFAAKRLEYRADSLRLKGKPFPVEPAAMLLAVTACSVILAVYVDRRWLAPGR
ncbi:DJ-1/PfpI family protein [Paenibacillus mucilaginosus]|uniref:DJ-1/PfpI domain-containing protein n=1 Tax=Paenibacillus mucilaginosus (strain KNP414) TaxID=1036673 RepID=F8FBS1_PAEMK|nr:DJ-1/PfpI family protein [Paenibacillus mucilaginosus]AEI43122.1 hypothetical protein KNP414_04592 [Paenibacillus mucilaginosus KNP414]MCG7212309.1 DJ-1/PfpI family protein [Paenibacillus mucilaginosus]WDM24729.1 DJ-1/PfpI family protein [Paenibacillus mucilaginosus]